MTRLERCKLAIERGYTYEPSTGKIYSRFGREITTKTSRGYIELKLTMGYKRYRIMGHQLAWYVIHNEVVDCLDHINGIKTDNRIDNLRSVTNQQNTFNTNAKGYTWYKNRNKWMSYIKVNGKTKHLGYHHTEEEARQVYLDAKKIYHKIS